MTALLQKQEICSNAFFEMCIYDTVRFGQLKKDLPVITNTMLTKALRELEEDRIITRQQFNEIPPHVEYSLTEMGRDLLPVFYAIMNWGFQHEKELYKVPPGAQRQLNDRHEGVKTAKAD